MKAIVILQQLLNHSLFFFILILGINLSNAQIINDKSNNEKPETDLHPEIFWDIKAYLPNVKLLDIKGIDSDGKIYDIKAIQYSEDTSLLDIKMFVNNQRLPVKLIIKNDKKYHPLKGIDTNGNIIDIKAITDKGEKWDVKGVSQSGNIIDIRAITKDGISYNVISISPEGKVNAVKGLKMLRTPLEMEIKGVPIFAHVKSMHQD